MKSVESLPQTAGKLYPVKYIPSGSGNTVQILQHVRIHIVFVALNDIQELSGILWSTTRSNEDIIPCLGPFSAL